MSRILVPAATIGSLFVVLYLLGLNSWALLAFVLLSTVLTVLKHRRDRQPT